MISIKNLLQEAADHNASDLHLISSMPPVLRIDGELIIMDKEKNISPKEMETMIFSLLDESQKDKFLNDKDLDFGYSLPNGVRFRVNICFEKNNLSLVARVISDKIPTMEEIGFPKVVYNLLNMEQGLILVTGPTGCGKSTTLAAMINYINNNRNCSIKTLEDPIEYIFKPQKSIITQRQLGSDMNFFASGLKYVLRQDPDVIMVGEMRDLETIAATITLAETGHLVLATLHTYSAAQTIDRVIDIFPPHQQNQVRLQVSTILKGVISQRLLPRIAGGRVAARELLLNTAAAANLIRENKVAQIRTIIETGSKLGMNSMDQDVKRLYDEKIISRETAESQMFNPELLDKYKVFK